jgi:hypothetical protein
MGVNRAVTLIMLFIVILILIPPLTPSDEVSLLPQNGTEWWVGLAIRSMISSRRGGRIGITSRPPRTFFAH